MTIVETSWPYPHTTPYLESSQIVSFPSEFGNQVTIAKLQQVNDSSPEFVTTEQDPSGRALSEPGTKADQGKDLPWLFHTGFANALTEVVKVTTLGARKYTPNGWATVPNGSERYMEGFARHMNKLAKGEVFDTGPGGLGTYHKAQMIWNLLASLELELREQNA
jgi:Domain of unknown function (DUF5664)